MSDPLTDPRAIDLLSADPNEVAALAGRFTTAAQESAATGAGLSTAQLQANWNGRAAEAFRRSIERLPRDLSRLDGRLTAASQALSAYETGLAANQSAFGQLGDQIVDTRGRLRQALTAQTQADAALQRAELEPHRVRRLAAAQQAADQAGDTVTSWAQEVDSLCARAMRILDAFEQERDSAQAAIGAAGSGLPGGMVATLSSSGSSPAASQ
jgi:uncharacterized protein YukE